jgi:fatty-acyl-CoA synthase
MWNVLTAVREAVREAPDRVRTSARLSHQSGMLWAFSAPGLVELSRVLLSGSQNPSLLYRVHARNTPNKAALVWRGRTVTYAELDRRIDRIASGLKKAGIGRKQSIVLMMRNSQEFIELGAAAARGRAAAVSVSWRSTPKELAYLATHSGARGIAIDAAFLPTLEQARGDLPSAVLENVFVVGGDAPRGTKRYETLLSSPGETFALTSADDDDAAVVIYTSGTTGKPKGAVRKFPKDTMYAAFRFIVETPMRVDDVHLVTCPLYHSTAYGFMSLSQIIGGTIVVMDEFKPETFLEDVERYGVTTTAVVPTMLQRIVDLPPETKQRYDVRSLRAVFSGGAPLPAAVGTDFMDEFGDILFNFYGATETGLVTLAKPRDLRAAPGTIGRAVPGNEIRLLDDERRDVLEGAVGELFVKNKLLVAGYHEDEQATNASMVDGFFSVGDLARRDRNGLYFIEGRKRDMVISGGVNVYPAEVEGVLEQHPEVAEAAVIGVPDREWGERVVAYVVRKSGALVEEGALKVFARERLSGAKVPREFVFVESLPRNPTGKVLKRELRQWSERAASGGPERYGS